VRVCLVSYESIKQEIQRRPIYECRCDERLKTKSEGSTLLGEREGKRKSSVVYYETIN
jgi:hypothetical protein